MSNYSVDLVQWCDYYRATREAGVSWCQAALGGGRRGAPQIDRKNYLLLHEISSILASGNLPVLFSI